MTDPRMNQEPARKPSDEVVELIVAAAIKMCHCIHAEEIALKSECAECGSHRGISVDTKDQVDDTIDGHVVGKCRNCGALTLISFRYDSHEDFMNSKPSKVYRTSYSTKNAPVSVPF